MKKKSVKSDNSESLLLDTSQDGFINLDSNMKTAKFNTISSASKNHKNETRFSSILEDNKAKSNPKLSYTFGDSSFIPLGKTAMIFVADELSYGLKDIGNSILLEYEEKYEKN